jgi:hypothetical protein
VQNFKFWGKFITVTMSGNSVPVPKSVSAKEVKADWSSRIFSTGSASNRNEDRNGKIIMFLGNKVRTVCSADNLTAICKQIV